jgi:hypothetical protein
MPKFKHLTNKIDMIYKYIRSIPIWYNFVMQENISQLLI